MLFANVNVTFTLKEVDNKTHWKGIRVKDVDMSNTGSINGPLTKIAQQAKLSYTIEYNRF